MTKELEGRLLASIPNVDAFQGLEARGLGADAFVEHRALYNYIADLIEEHGHLPRIQDLRATFDLPDYVKRETQEFDWLVSELLKLGTARRVQSVVDGNVLRFGDEPQALVDGLIRDLTSISMQEGRHVSVTDASAVDRMGRYAEQADNLGMMRGIPTGLSYFDVEERIGWMPGELIGLIGRTYIGKTWILMMFGVIGWQAGKRVLFISPELTIAEAETRFDMLVFGQENVKITATQLYRGHKPTAKMMGVARQVAERENWITVTSIQGQPFRLGEVPRLIRQYTPDLVLVDGLPLLASGRAGQQTWEMIKDLSYGLKNIAVGSDTVIITAHQANRGAANQARPPGLHEVAFGDAFVQACDRVLALSKPQREGTLKVTIQKFRKGKPKTGGVNFVFDPGEGKVHEDASQPDTGTLDGLGLDGDIAASGAGDVDAVPIP